jgi:hypothetical protein
MNHLAPGECPNRGTFADADEGHGTPTSMEIHYMLGSHWDSMHILQMMRRVGRFPTFFMNSSHISVATFSHSG